MRPQIIPIILMLVGGATVAGALGTQVGHGMAPDHGAPGHKRPAPYAVLTEPGQGAFAALSKLARPLEADPETDWSRVDLSALRRHLVDMGRLISDVIVTETDLPAGIRILATGTPEAIATLRRMVPAHAMRLAEDDRWTVGAAARDDGIELRVESDDPATVRRIRGLGFFGLMARQDHHRQHHLAMARGDDPHGH